MFWWLVEGYHVPRVELVELGMLSVDTMPCDAIILTLP